VNDEEENSEFKIWISICSFHPVTNQKITNFTRWDEFPQHWTLQRPWLHSVCFHTRVVCPRPFIQQCNTWILQLSH